MNPNESTDRSSSCRPRSKQTAEELVQTYQTYGTNVDELFEDVEALVDNGIDPGGQFTTSDVEHLLDGPEDVWALRQLGLVRPDGERISGEGRETSQVWRLREAAVDAARMRRSEGPPDGV